VWANNTYGAGPVAVSNTITTPSDAPTTIGQAYAGGYYAGQISTTANNVATYYLVVGPASSSQTTREWKTIATDSPGTSSTFDGSSNSYAMNNATHPAALFCTSVTAGGYSDWYMPSKYELEICYYNLKPTTTSNNINAGINANAVPARASNYTAGTPAQTSAADFKDTGTEDFTAFTRYWSSTQNSSYSTYGNYQYFSNGYQFGAGKNGNRPVRAVRRVAV
jgi:hypothetical protein